MNAVIYCRISRDATAEAAGVRRQEAECRGLARLRGLEVDEVFVDNDVSAYNGARRPQYQRLLERVASGDVGAILAWHPDRLHRSLRELEEFITLVDAHSVEVLTVTAGDVDLATPVGRMIARQLGTFARYESEHRSERVKAALRDQAQQGRWVGRRPYGYDYARDASGQPLGDGRLEIVANEAAVIRQAASRVLAGETPYGICREFNERGVPAPLGGRWKTPSLRALLVSPTAAGGREYRGTVVAEGLWKPILAAEQHAALRQRLSDNRRTKGALPAKRYLLSRGLTVCGRCGARLATLRRAGSNRRVYSCIKSTDRDGCGRLSVSAVPLEQHVIREVFAHIGLNNVAKLIANPHAFQRELVRRTAIEARLLELADMYAHQEISRAEWKVARATLARQLTTLPDQPSHLGGITLGDATDMQHQWDALHIDRRRALLQLVIDIVVINPSRQGPRLRPERVDIRWR